MSPFWKGFFTCLVAGFALNVLGYFAGYKTIVIERDR